jgi:flavin reductase (DIM6/NTAB) family NADH-FMN oxidoreductase RutF
MDIDRFRQAMRRYASGVCVVAANRGADRCGMTVSAVSSVSAEPPMILVCLNRNSSSHGALVTAERFSVNILRAGDEDLAMIFAGQSGLRGADKFNVGTWSCAGAPVLDTSLQTLLCEPAACHDAGSHTILIGHVVDVFGNSDGSAMVNFEGSFHQVPLNTPRAA